MIEWNREVAGAIQLLLVAILFVLMIINKKKLGNGIIYFIIATSIILSIDTFLYTIRFINPKFNSVLLYSIGMNLIVFLLFFLYFRNILESKIAKKINLFIICIFLISYCLFAVFTDQFFTKFPFQFYFVEVVLLIGNVFLVLRETFNSDRVLKIKSYYPFWACIGLMSIYLGVAPLLIISNAASKMMSINIFFIILFFVNVIGYSILIAGIFFAKNNNLKK